MARTLAAIILVGALGGIGEVEQMTATADGFALTWVSDAPSIGLVLCGQERDELGPCGGEDKPSRFHQVIVTGLEPGRKYYYRLQNGESFHPPVWLPPLQTSTLKPPGGPEIFSFAVMNDLHTGEDVAGLMVPPGPWLPLLTPGFTWKNPVENYHEFTLAGAVDAINRSGAAFCVVNGDLTSWYTREEFVEAKKRLDRLDKPYYVARGNHDRIGDQGQDNFSIVFGLESSWYGFDYEGFHFVVLDDSRLADGGHGFSEEEFGWFSRDLDSHRNMPTFVFSHRPFGPGVGDVDKGIRSRLLRILASHPQVVGVFAGHSHRANIERVSETGELPYFEVPSVKEYPLGYGMVKVYEGGYTYSFMPVGTGDCKEWRHVTRDEYFGLAPRMLRRGPEHRSMVYKFDAVQSGLIRGQTGGQP